MKWVGLALFIALIPILVAWLRANPVHAPKLWIVFGLAPLVVEPIHGIVAPISWPAWAGYVKGLEVSIIDSLAISILLSRAGAVRVPPFAGLWAAYIVTILISMAAAGVPQAAFFAAWQTARIALIAWAAASICLDERGPKALLTGMCVGLAINAGFSLEQRVTGSLQADGLYSHQNLLGMVSHFVAFPALAYFIADNRQKLMVVGVAAAMIVAILGASRATIALAGAGYLLLLLLSVLRKPSPRKWAVVASGLVALAIATPIAMSSLDRRFDNTEQVAGDYDERAAFEDTAKAMIADNPMGVGANQYVVVSNTRGYSDIGGVVAVFGSRAAHVHHAYLLIAAEIGYLGLTAFVALLVWPALFGLWTAWRFKGDPRGELLLGYSTALIVVAVHCFVEWVFVTYSVQMLFGMVAGSVVGLSKRMAWRDSKLRRDRRAARSQPDTRALA